MKSCALLAADVNGAKVTTIESLAENGKLHLMQEAFKKASRLTVRLLYTRYGNRSAVDLLKNKILVIRRIREWLEANICRCTGYQNIVATVKDAASKM